MFVWLAVLENDLHARGLFTRSSRHLSGLQRLAQLHHVTGRLGQIDVHRISLLNGGQMGRLPLTDQRPFGHHFAADASRNRCSYMGIA